MISVVLNARSGQTGRAGVRDEIASLFEPQGVDVHISVVEQPAEIPMRAREALAANAEAVVAAGGDGTISAVAAVLAGGSVPLGVLPLGTLNHFAKDIGIPLDLPKAVEVIAARHVRQIDVGRVNECIFVNNSSLGVYPSMVQTRERLREEKGYSKWTALAVATIETLRREDELSIRLEADRTKMIARTPFVVVGNNEYRVEGIGIVGRTRLDAGRLYAYFAPPVRTRQLPNLLAHALFGLAHAEHLLSSLATTELWIDTFGPKINVACDGELHVLATPLHYRTWPRALNVFAPGA
jgi:diacylglycerol kinase family enzyme